MKYIDEFRNVKLVRSLVKEIRAIIPSRQINVMEVCGTHTQSFYRFGIDKLLPENLRLISGPGCPVCVSSQEYLDAAIALAGDRSNFIVSFGDMLRVPGTFSTLEKERAHGANVAIVYSALNAQEIARKYPQKKVIFLAVGFETTAGTIAASLDSAARNKINNLYFFSELKLIPPAIRHLLRDPRLKIDAFLCPGHVSVIIGTRPYEFIAREYGKGCCVAGFEPVDILEGLYLLLAQIVKKKPKVENQYIRAVKKRGNLKAQSIIKRVFQVTDAAWRGLGNIPHSGLKIRRQFYRFDCRENLSVKTRQCRMNTRQKECRCADVLKGLARPDECPSFKKTCTPQNAFGPCMVSQEGACNVYYKYQT